MDRFFLTIQITVSKINVKLKMIHIFIFVTGKGANNMGSYKTIQKDSLLTFFRAHCHEAMTTHQIYQRMQIDSIDYVPGESTIYRLVKQLTDSGVLVRSIDPQSRQFLFRLAEGEQCCCKVRMQCKNCGKIIEMDKIRCG